MRLNGWQRIGVILSVLWALGAAWYQRDSDIHRAEGAFHVAYQICHDIQDGATLRGKELNPEKCTAEGERSWALALEGTWAGVAFVSMAPIPAGWIGAYLLRAIWRWVRTGFASS